MKAFQDFQCYFSTPDYTTKGTFLGVHFKLAQIATLNPLKPPFVLWLLKYTFAS